MLKQRVHGVVDLYGAKKPSHGALRDESSPVEALDVSSDGNALKATLRTRALLPAYTLTGYRLRWVVYSAEGYPVEQHEAELPDMAPAASTRSVWASGSRCRRACGWMCRPTGFSARSAVWTA